MKESHVILIVAIVFIGLIFAFSKIERVEPDLSDPWVICQRKCTAIDPGGAMGGLRGAVMQCVPECVKIEKFAKHLQLYNRTWECTIENKEE